MTDHFALNTSRLQLRILDSSAAPAVLDYYVRNRFFHQPWFAARNDQVFRLEEQKADLADEYAGFLAGRALPSGFSAGMNPIESSAGSLSPT